MGSNRVVLNGVEVYTPALVGNCTISGLGGVANTDQKEKAIGVMPAITKHPAISARIFRHCKRFTEHLQMDLG